eukprot:SAG22_NODE_919_length_6498_cov_3.971402_2_plen_587_part_00
MLPAVAGSRAATSRHPMPRAKPASAGERPLTADGRRRRPHWALGEDERAADEAARAYWAERTREAEVKRAGEERLQEADAEARNRLRQLKKDGLAFVYGSDAAARPASAGPRLPRQKSFREPRGAPVPAEIIELTPRGSEVVKTEEFNVNKLPSQSVRIGVGLWVEPEDEPPEEPRGGRRGRPQTAGPATRRRSRASKPRPGAGGLGTSVATAHLTQVDMTVLQGGGNENMALASGTTLRSTERDHDGKPAFQRKGARVPVDPNRMSKKFYDTHVSGRLFSDSFPRTAGQSQELAEETADQLVTGLVDWSAGRDWMEDARPIVPALDEEEELLPQQSVAASGQAVNQHTAFNQSLKNDKDWGSNVPAAPAEYCPPPLPHKSPMVQLQRLERDRRVREEAAKEAEVERQRKAEALRPLLASKERTARVDELASSTVATAAVQQLHKQLVVMNASSQIKMTRARAPHSRKTAPAPHSRKTAPAKAGQAGTTDRNLWPTHQRFGVVTGAPNRRGDSRAQARSRSMKSTSAASVRVARRSSRPASASLARGRQAAAPAARTGPAAAEEPNGRPAGGFWSGYVSNLHGSYR